MGIDDGQEIKEPDMPNPGNGNLENESTEKTNPEYAGFGNVSPEKANPEYAGFGNVSPEDINPGKKRKNKGGRLIILFVCILVVLIAAIFFFLFFGEDDYQKPLKETQAVLNERSTSLEEISKVLLPDFAAVPVLEILDTLKSSQKGQNVIEEVENSIDIMYDDMEDTLGEDIHFAYKVKTSEKMSRNELSGLEGEYQNLYYKYVTYVIAAVDLMSEEQIDKAAEQLGISKKQLQTVILSLRDFGDKLKGAKITQGYALIIDISAVGSGDNRSWEDKKIQIIEINGSWMIDYITLLSDSDFSLSDLYRFME